MAFVRGPRGRVHRVVRPGRPIVVAPGGMPVRRRRPRVFVGAVILVAVLLIAYLLFRFYVRQG